MEFLLLHRQAQYLIETKRQSVPGSVDEKYPYIVENAKSNIGQGREYVLVLDGDGPKPGAIKWIRQQAADIDGFHVFDRKEFVLWLDDLFADDQH